MTQEELLNGEFLKQFKDSKDFGNFMDTLYKRGVETISTNNKNINLSKKFVKGSTGIYNSLKHIKFKFN